MKNKNYYEFYKQFANVTCTLLPQEKIPVTKFIWSLRLHFSSQALFYLNALSEAGISTLFERMNNIRIFYSTFSKKNTGLDRRELLGFRSISPMPLESPIKILLVFCTITISLALLFFVIELIQFRRFVFILGKGNF